MQLQELLGARSKMGTRRIVDMARSPVIKERKLSKMIFLVKLQLQLKFGARDRLVDQLGNLFVAKLKLGISRCPENFRLETQSQLPSSRSS
jgi:hypothetical protein